MFFAQTEVLTVVFSKCSKVRVVWVGFKFFKTQCEWKKFETFPLNVLKRKIVKSWRVYHNLSGNKEDHLWICKHSHWRYPSRRRRKFCTFREGNLPKKLVKRAFSRELYEIVSYFKICEYNHQGAPISAFPNLSTAH